MKVHWAQIVVIAAAAGLLVVGATGTSSSGSEPVPVSAGGASKRVNGKQARQLVQGGAVLVDVRTPAEFAAGHIDGAVNIPVDQIAQRAGEIGPADTQIVLYCRSGARSSVAARKLAGLGYSSVYDLGPKSAW